MGTSLSFAPFHAKSTRNPVLFLIAKSIRKSAKVQVAKLADAAQHHPADLAIDSPYLLDLLPDRWASTHPKSVREGRIEEREDVLDAKRLRRTRARIEARAAQAAGS